jgi:hypothetical protein
MLKLIGNISYFLRLVTCKKEKKRKKDKQTITKEHKIYVVRSISVHTSSELHMERLPHAAPPNKASLTCAASHEPAHHSITAAKMSTLHHAHHSCLHSTRKESIIAAQGK